MSEMEEDQILENAGEELQELEEKPKSFLLLVAVILGALALILSLVSIVQNKGANTGEATVKIEGAAGVDGILDRIDALEQKVGNLSSSLDSFNAIGNTALETEVAKLKGDLRSLQTQVGKKTSAIPSRPATTPASPPTEPQPATTSTAKPPVPPGGKIHKLQEGETFSSLAKTYGIPVEKIMSANQGLDPLKLQVGQEIVIPGPK